MSDSALHGISGAPYSHPNVRKKVPNPYQRPSISVGGTQVKRQWAEVRVHDLAAGDVVPGVGLIADVREDITVPDHLDDKTPIVWKVTITNAFGKTFTYPGEHTVMAYTPEE